MPSCHLRDLSILLAYLVSLLFSTFHSTGQRNSSSNKDVTVMGTCSHRCHHHSQRKIPKSHTQSLKKDRRMLPRPSRCTINHFKWHRPAFSTRIQIFFLFCLLSSTNVRRCCSTQLPISCCHGYST